MRENEAHTTSLCMCVCVHLNEYVDEQQTTNESNYILAITTFIQPEEPAQ